MDAGIGKAKMPSVTKGNHPVIDSILLFRALTKRYTQPLMTETTKGT